jgi:hypothetical protein
MNSFLLNSLNKISIVEPGNYRYYRWNIINVLVSGNAVQSAEFVFQINGVDQSMSGITISNPGGSNPLGEEPPKLIDNNLNTKWLDFNIRTNGYSNIIFDFGAGQMRKFNGYRWATANDNNGRDSKSWIVAGSNNGVNWTTLSTVTNFVPTINRNTWQSPQTY